MLAKLAIVEVLHEAECKSKVCFDEYDHEGKPVSMAKVSDTGFPDSREYWPMVRMRFRHARFWTTSHSSSSTTTDAWSTI